MPTRMTQPKLEFVDASEPNSQRVVILDAPFQVKIAHARIPEPGTGEVRVKITYVGICGSDVETYRGVRDPEFVSFPTRLGHEVAGVIDKIGEGVVGLQLGDHVVLRYVWGAFAEYIVCQPFSIQVVPKTFPLLEASLIEILPGVIHTAELGQISPTKNVLVMGQGVSGLILTQVLRLYSPKTLVVTDLFEKNLALARQFGATHTYQLPDSNTPSMDILWKDFPDGFDVVIPCLLEGDGFVDAIECAAQNGRIILYGCIGPCTQRVDLYKIHRKRLDVYSTEPKRDIDMRRFFEEGLRLVLGGLVNTKAMVTHVLGLSQEEIVQAFKLREKPSPDVIHVIINCDRESSFRVS